MKKFLLSLFAVLSASFAFAGDGTKANPMTVADVLAATMDGREVYVKGYIVGSCTGTGINSAEFGVSDKSSVSNFLLADDVNETSTDNVIAAQMPTAVRAGLALKNKPENLGKLVTVKAQLQKYFGKNGIKNISEYVFEGEETVDITNTPETAYTVSQARELIDANEGLFAFVYVKGEVMEGAQINTTNGDATYDITDGNGATLTVYRGKYLENKSFTNEDQLQDGDEVVVYGQLQLYTNQAEGTSTYEIAQGNYLYSLNGETEAGDDPTPGPVVTSITIQEAQALAANSTATVEGAIVYALCTNGAVLGDATGYIYYFNKSISGLAVGDQVTISGAVSSYGGFNQFTNTATVTKTGSVSSVTYPVPTEINLDTWVATPTIQYVKLTATLNISGNYYNLIVDGATAKGSIVGPVADMFTGIASDTTVTVEGFAMYTSGSSTKYANIIATKVTTDGEGGGGDPDPDPDPTPGPDPDPIIDGTEILTNGSFEEWADDMPVDWKSTNSASTAATVAQSTDAHEGTYAVEIKSTASTNKRLASKEIALEAGTYTFSIWMKSAGEASVAKMGYAYMDGTSIKYVYFMGDDNKEIEYSITPEYTEYTGTFTLETATTINLVVMNNKKSKAVSIIADDASLKKTEGGGGTDQKEDITNEATAPYTVSQAINFIDNKDTYDLSKVVYVMGEVAEVTEVSTDHGNATYTITDGNNTITIYRGKYLENKNFTNADQIQDGDEVVVYGKLTLYQKEGEESQYQMAQGNYLYSLNGKTEPEPEPTPDYSQVEALSIAEFLQKADTQNMYKLTGVVRNVVNTTFGNFDLCDQDNEETKIYIYGVVKADDLTNNKVWQSLEVNEGDILTIVGTYTTFKETPQIAKAIYIGHEKGSEPTVDITNTPETAYTVAEANELITAGKGLSAKVYVKGIISEIKSLDVSKWKRAQYYISDDGTTTNQFLIYNGYYLEGHDFQANDQIKVNDNVIVYGQLTNYNGTYEMVQDNFIYSHNGVLVDGINEVNAGLNADKSILYDLSGRRVEKAVKGLYIVNGKKVVIK